MNASTSRPLLSVICYCLALLSAGCTELKDRPTGVNAGAGPGGSGGSNAPSCSANDDDCDEPQSGGNGGSSPAGTGGDGDGDSDSDGDGDRDGGGDGDGDGDGDDDSDLPGNRKEDAYPLSLESGYAQWPAEDPREYVGTQDTKDYYAIELAEHGTLTWSADVQEGRPGMPSGTVHLNLYRDAQLINESAPLDTTSASDMAPGTKARHLSRGVYYLRATPAISSNCLYQIRLSFEPYENAEPSPAPGNDPDEPYDIGQLSSVVSYGGYVAEAGTEDYYRFRVASTTVTMAGKEVRGRAYIELFKDELILGASLLNVDAQEGPNDASNYTALEAGDYLVRVSSPSGAPTLYRLDLTTE